MTVSIANTNLNDNFNTWRLNTNFASTVISNNVVTVSRAGSANRGGVAKGNGHVSGTFTANELRATTIKSGNTTNDAAFLFINSNTSVNAHSLSITANTTFQGNVDFSVTGTNRIILGDISRIRMTGGTRGQFLRLEDQSDVVNFKSLSLRDIQDLSSNSAHLILSGSNASFSDNNDSPALILTNGADRARFFLSSQNLGESDVFLNLVDDDGDSRFVITNSTNSEIFSVTSSGRVTFTANATVGGISTTGNILPESGQNNQYDLGAPNRKFRNLWVDNIGNIDELKIGTASGQGVSTSLIPKTDAVGNLGSTTRKWGTVWADNTNGGSGVFSGVGVSGNINANGNLTVSGTSSVTDSASFASEVTIEGKTQINGNTVISSNTTIQDRLDVSGNTSLKGSVELGDQDADVITVKGHFANQSTSGLATFDGNVQFKGNFVQTNNTQLRGDLIPDTDDGIGHYDLGTSDFRFNQIYANNSFANNLSVDNNAIINGDLTIIGETTLQGAAFSSPVGSFVDLSVSNDSDLEGDVNIGLTSADNLTINSSIDSNLIPDGSRNIGSASGQWNNLYLGGSIFDGSTTIIGKNNKLHANNTITDGTIRDVMLENSGVTAGTYGTASEVPQITVDSKGLVTNIATATVSGVTSFNYNAGDFTIGTATGTDFTATVPNATTTVKGIASFNTNDFSVSSGGVSIKSGGVTSSQLAATAVTAGSYGDSVTIPTFTVNAKGQLTNATDVAIPDATTASKGIAQFDPDVFDVTSGTVSLAGGSGGAVLTVNGTTNEIEVSRNQGEVTVGLPNDVVISGQLNVSENVVVTGNLVVQGTTTTVNSETVNIADNIIVLNSNETGTPSQNGGITIERGTGTNKSFLWDETADNWTVGTDSIVASNFIGTATQVSNSVTPGNYLTGSAFDGSSATTFAVDATDQNTAGKVVARNASGNFSAGTITATLNGNASTASKWNTARTLTLGGDLSGSASFDGSAGFTLSASINNGAVDSAAIQNGAVGVDQLAVDAVTTSRVQNKSITAAKLADGAVSASIISNGSVTADKLASDSVNRSKIADDAVGANELRDVVRLDIKNSSGSTLKTIFGAGS